MLRAFWYQLLSAILSLFIFLGAALSLGILTARDKPRDETWMLAAALFATAVSVALLVWVRVARARWLLEKALREAEGNYFAAVPDLPVFEPSHSLGPGASPGPGGRLWLTGLKYDAASALLVVVLLAGSFGATAAAGQGWDVVFRRAPFDPELAGLLAGSLALAAAGLVPLVLVRKARARWLSNVAIYEGYGYFRAYARDRASKVGDAVEVARADGIFGHLFKQAADRALITPSVVFYRQLQAKRGAGEITEEEYRGAVEELMEHEVAWRRKGGKA